MAAPPPSPPRRMTRARAKVIESDKLPAIRDATSSCSQVSVTSTKSTRFATRHLGIAISHRTTKKAPPTGSAPLRTSGEKVSESKPSSRIAQGVQKIEDDTSNMDCGPENANQGRRGLVAPRKPSHAVPKPETVVTSCPGSKSASRDLSKSKAKYTSKISSSRECGESEKENVETVRRNVKYRKTPTGTRRPIKQEQWEANSNKALRGIPLSPKKTRQVTKTARPTSNNLALVHRSSVADNDQNVNHVKYTDNRSDTKPESILVNNGVKEANDSADELSHSGHGSVATLNKKIVESLPDAAPSLAIVLRKDSADQNKELVKEHALGCSTSGLAKSPRKFAKIPGVLEPLKPLTVDSTGALKSPPRKLPSGQKPLSFMTTFNRPRFSPATSLFQSPARRSPSTRKNFSSETSSHVYDPSPRYCSISTGSQLFTNLDNTLASPLREKTSRPVESGTVLEPLPSDSWSPGSRSLAGREDSIAFPLVSNHTQGKDDVCSPTPNIDTKMVTRGDIIDMPPPEPSTPFISNRGPIFNELSPPGKAVNLDDDDSEDELALSGTLHGAFLPMNTPTKTSKAGTDRLPDRPVAKADILSEVKSDPRSFAAGQSTIDQLSPSFETRSTESYKPIDDHDYNALDTTVQVQPFLELRASPELDLYRCEENVQPIALSFELNRKDLTETETCTPARLLNIRTEVNHTISKIPLRPEGGTGLVSSSQQSRKGRSKSLTTMLSPQADLELQVLRQIHPAGDPQAKQEYTPKMPISSHFHMQEEACKYAESTPMQDLDLYLCAKTPRQEPCSRLDGKLLAGAIVFVDVHTSDGADANGVFMDLLTQMGAKCVKQWSWNPWSSSGSKNSTRQDESQKPAITHVVFKDGARRTMEKVRQAKGIVLCVGVSWVLDCERNNQWMDEDLYAIDTQAMLRGSNRRRKSMEPKILSYKDGAMVAKHSPNKSTRSTPFTSTMKRIPDSLQSQQQPRFLASHESPVLVTPRDSSKLKSMDYSGESPTTPYFLHPEQLVQQTCPRQIAPLYFPLSGRLEDTEDDSMRNRLAAARRKSLQFVPKVASPLGRARE